MQTLFVIVKILFEIWCMNIWNLKFDLWFEICPSLRSGGQMNWFTECAWPAPGRSGAAAVCCAVRYDHQPETYITTSHADWHTHIHESTNAVRRPMCHIYIFYSPEMVATRKKKYERGKTKNTQISKAKARKTNLLTRQPTQISKTCYEKTRRPRTMSATTRLNNSGHPSSLPTQSCCPRGLALASRILEDRSWRSLPWSWEKILALVS